MSNIKMCNRHSGMFMDGEEGSSKVKVEINRRYDTGEAYVQHETWDFCKGCTDLMQSPSQVDRAAIARMEAEAGIPTLDQDIGVIPRREKMHP